MREIKYHDYDGNAVPLFELVQTEPGWATNRINELERTRDLYYDLIYVVSNKEPTESRHDTAKRYLVERETQHSDPVDSQGAGVAPNILPGAYSD